MIVVNSKIQACGTCVQIIANGEDTSQDDGGQAHAERMAECYGVNVTQLVLDKATDLDDDSWELGFCSTACEVCGDPLAGDRFAVAELG